MENSHIGPNLFSYMINPESLVTANAQHNSSSKYRNIVRGFHMKQHGNGSNPCVIMFPLDVQFP